MSSDSSLLTADPVEASPTLAVAPLDLGRIAQDLQIRKVQVESVARLLDDGNTVPFITRYRKERTGGCDEELIRLIQKRVILQRQLAERKQTILKSIQAQGKLTDELHAAILAAQTPKRLEDLYLPYKPKKRSLATAAREKGLEPLAQAIWNKEATVANLAELLPTFVNPEKQLTTVEEVQLGVQHILAEQIAETAEIRAASRRIMWETGRLTAAKSEKVPDGQGLEYRDYFQFTEPVRHIPPHRILAINRGEKEGALKVKMEWHDDQLRQAVFEHLPLADHPHADFLKTCGVDALQRLIVQSLEREIRRELTEEAEDHAVQVFSRNLRNLLLQPPIHGRRILAIDPGFRTGCKLAALDEIGNLLEESVIYPHQVLHRREGKKASGQAPTQEAKPEAASAPDAAMPTPVEPPTATEVAGEISLVVTAPDAQTQETSAAVASAEAPTAESPTPVPVNDQTHPATDVSAPSAAQITPPPSHKREDAKAKLDELIKKHQLTLIALGNGTACRETEELIAELIAEKLSDLAYVIVNEAGASHYSTSPIGREEFPDLDATARGTVSIGRRLQDPLSELVKIDPQNIGVGLYQHDISQNRLKESLEEVIGSCVNHVGVDLNTASVPLLRHVSGLNQLTARMVVEFRKERGPFKDREQLKQINGVGEATFTQAAGFLRIKGGDNPLDGTWIHPESYSASCRLLEHFGYSAAALQDNEKNGELREKFKTLSPAEICKQLELGEPTLRDILEALAKPGRDPREDLPKPIFKKGVLQLEDLQQGMELKGTILNVVDFGAFVDVGLKDSGLVHVSQLANRYVKSPYEVVSVGDVVTVWVLSVDADRKRVSFTMVKPGTVREKKPLPERKPRPQRRGRPPAQAQGQPASAPTPRPASAQVAIPGQPTTGIFVPPPPRAAPPRRAPQHQQQQHRQYHPPKREKPKPKLTDEALQGEAPLRTFAELKALYEAKKPEEPVGQPG